MAVVVERSRARLRVEERRAMSGWFVKNLGDAMLAGEEMERIERSFAAAYARAGHPTGMAVLIRHESDGRLHCELKAYFSPASADFARAVGASPCERPLPWDLGVLAGNGGVLASLCAAPSD
jgi:hypothetical protein